MRKLKKKLAVTMLILSVSFMSLFAPFQESMMFGQRICYATTPASISLKVLMDMLFGIGVTASGNSLSDAYSEWKSESYGNTIEDIEAFEQQVREEYEYLVVTNTGDATTEVQSYIDTYFTVNDDGTYTPSDEILKDGKLIVPSSVVKSSADMFDSLTANCTVENIKGAKLAGANNYVYMSEVDCTLDQLFDRYGDTFKEVITSTFDDYDTYAYLGINDSVLIIPSDSCLATTNGGYLHAGCYNFDAFDNFFLNYDSQLYSASALEAISSVTLYEYSTYSKSVSEFGTSSVSSYLYYDSTGKPFLNNGAIPYNLGASGSALAFQRVLVTSLFYLSCIQLCPVVSSSAFSKVADTVEQDVTIDLTDENIDAISNAATLDDVINAVDASSAELTSIRDGISDTNEKLDDTNAELSGISGILSSIYDLLKGNKEGTLFDFVYLMCANVVTILSLLQSLVEKVDLLSDISDTILSINAFVISLPKNIADAISDTFPALAQEIADAISDTFPFDAQDIADAISDTFPFDAQDIADAISDTFPALAQKIADAISDVYPYVDIQEIIDGLSLPSAEDIADAVSKALPTAQDIADKLNIPAELAKVIAAIQALPLAIANNLADILNISLDIPWEELKAITWNVSIPGLLELIVSAIKQAVLALVIPDEMVISSRVTALEALFDEKFGTLQYPFELLQRFSNALYGNTDDFILTLPALKVFDYTISKEYTLNVSQAIKKYSEWYSWYIIITDLVILTFFLKYVNKKLEDVLKN